MDTCDRADTTVRPDRDPFHEAEARLNRPIGYVLEKFPQQSETFIENELRVLGEMGADLHVVSLRHPQPSAAGPTSLPAERLSYAPPTGARVSAFVRWVLRRPGAVVANVWIALRHRSQTMLRAAFDAAWVASHFEQLGVSHVHAHFATEAASVAMPVARLLRVRFTFTIHAIELYLRTRGLCTKARAAAQVVTVCEYNVEQLRARCPGLDPARISLVYCGVDPNEFALRPPPAPAGSFHVLSVGRLVPKKGFGDLIEAVALLRERGIEVTCDIIGEGHIRAELEGAIAGLHLGGSVRLLAARSNEEVRDALGACDVFALACVVDAEGDRDSMPVVVKEAMAVGVPVVATREVGIPEMIDDEVGRLARPNDPVSLADALASVAALSPAERRALGVAGRARVATRFDLRRETAKLAAIFDTVMST